MPTPISNELQPTSTPATAHRQEEAGPACAVARTAGQQTEQRLYEQIEHDDARKRIRDLEAVWLPGSSWAGLSACNVWLPAPAAEPSSRGKCRNGTFSSDQAGAMHAEAAVQEQFMCPGNQTGRVWFPSGYRLARLSGGRLSQASSERARLQRNEVQVRFPGARLSADFCTGRHESDGDASNQSPVSCMRRAWLAV